MSATTRPRTVPAVLDAAAGHIEKVGLAREVLVDDDGCCCPAGAINFVVFDDAAPSVELGDKGRLASEAKKTLIDAVRPEYREVPTHRTELDGAIGDWSDVTHQADVIATLRRVAQQQRMLWRPANHGTGERIWFLVRAESVPIENRYYTGADDQLIRYASYETARQAAADLNAQQQRQTAQGGGA